MKQGSLHGMPNCPAPQPATAWGNWFWSRFKEEAADFHAVDIGKFHGGSSFVRLQGG